jgi:hypothetical protein
MDIDTSHSMSSEAAKYLRYAKQCAKAAEQTTDPTKSAKGFLRWSPI